MLLSGGVGAGKLKFEFRDPKTIRTPKVEKLCAQLFGTVRVCLGVQIP